jgi:hypothetical protein
MNEPPETPWKRATVKRQSMRSERHGAKMDGGRVVPMSGAGRQKGDVRTDMWLSEDKTTEKESFTVTKKALDKIENEALHTPPGLLPQFRISMPGHRWRMIREQDYLYLVAKAAQKNDEDANASS